MNQVRQRNQLIINLEFTEPVPAPSSEKESINRSKTAPIEVDYAFEMDDDEYLSTYNYYIYYNNIKPRDPRLKKPTWVPKADIDFIRKGEKDNPQ